MGRCCIYGTNPGYTNPGYTNPGTTNPGYYSPAYTNPGYTNPGSTSYFSCNCQTCSYQGLSVIRSVASTITAMTTWAISALVQSFRVKTSGTTITTSVYSDTDLVTQIGSDMVYAATGAAVFTRHGITIKPSSTSQSYSAGELNITRNP